MNHLSLFSGIGGLDLAAEWAGFETVGQCEFADYPTKVLEKHWPDVPRWRDVRDVTALSIQQRGIGRIHIISGGFPCQPHSLAGKCRASADERDLWGEYARIIREIKPRWVVAENVPGLFYSEGGRFFGRILNDLAAMGYFVGWCCYGASSVGAPHRRNRIFVIAYNANAERYSNGCNVGDSRTTEGWENRKKIGCEYWQQFELVNSKVAPSEWRRKGQPSDARPLFLRNDDGISRKLDESRLKCLGNAVVPQQA